MKRIFIFMFVFIFAISALLMGVSCKEEATTELAEEETEKINLEDFHTKGPAGEIPVPLSDLSFSEEEKEEIRKGNYKAAIMMHADTDVINALKLGVRYIFDDLNIEVVSETVAEMNPAKQQQDAETILALDPDIICVLPMDPVSAAEAFRPAVEQGVKLAIMSNVPEGYVHGEDYVGMVSDNFFELGEIAADILAEALNYEGKIGWIFHDANYYVTNQRDNSFKAVIQANYPDIEIVSEKGVVAADAADGERAASAIITQYPDVDGLYVTWDTPAEGAVAAARAANRPDIKIVTIDLGAINGLDMVEGGNMVGAAADIGYELGVGLAMVGAYGLINKPAPAFTMVGSVRVTKENYLEGWRTSFHSDPPKEIMDELLK